MMGEVVRSGQMDKLGKVVVFGVAALLMVSF